MRLILIACATVVLLIPSAFAGKPGGERIAKAEELAKKGRYHEAAALFGAEMAAAQKKKDLAWQERTARSMRDAMKVPVGKKAGEEDEYARCLEAVMLALDPKRNHAFCSAGQLSHALLMNATFTGDYAHVEAAARVCASHAKISKVGSFAGAMADYAAGLLDVAGGESKSAIPRFEAALDVTSREGWAWPSIHVATELAAACVAASQDDKAAAALAKAAIALKESGDRAVAQRFREVVRARLERASETVLSPYEAAMERFSGGSSVGAAGGRGGRGGKGASAGRAREPDLSKVGRAWKKQSRKKPFVTVTRTADGYVIRQGFDKEFEARQPTKHGVKHHDDGGITLSFWDGCTRLAMVDLTGLQGQPGERSEPHPFALFHPLARGYTWGVTKDGVVTETRGR